VRALDRRLLRRSRPARRLLAVDCVLGLGVALLVLAQAVLLARIVAGAFGGETLRDLRAALLALTGVVALRAASAWGFETAGRLAATGVLSGLRLDLAETRLRRDPAALDGAESGELTATAVNGVDSLEAWFARYVPALVLACVVPLAVLALVASVDFLSAALLLLTLPVIPVFMWLIGRRTDAVTRRRWQALALLSSHFLDVVRGLPTLRAFNRGDAQAERLEAVGDEYRRATMATLRVAFLSGAVLELAATLGVALVAVTVGVRLVEGGIGFQAALVVLIAAPETYSPLRNLASSYHASADGSAVSKRLLDAIEAPSVVEGGRARVPAGDPIRFERVSFAYPGRDVLVLEDVDLELDVGETLALVGPSGCGKSTLASLLLRLADPTAGSILVGDRDLRTVDVGFWRSQLAWLPQEPTLLAGTIADNIRLADPTATDARVREAARLAGADRFILGLPRGYATPVGDGSRSLSAGERRRIGLARAFLRDAPLVILDEPTANLDDRNAGLVADAIERLLHTRTVLLIAHRPRLAGLADRVVTLDHGRLPRVLEPA
jgi:ATP-binding cassette, subfamily C, bacterial CydD